MPVEPAPSDLNAAAGAGMPPGGDAVVLSYAAPGVGRFAAQPPYSRFVCEWDEQGLRLVEPSDGRVRRVYWIVGILLELIWVSSLVTALLMWNQQGWWAAHLPHLIFALLAAVGGALAIAEGEAQRRWPTVIQVGSGWLVVDRPTILSPQRQWWIHRLCSVRADPAGLEMPHLRMLGALVVVERIFWLPLRPVRVLVRPYEECQWLAALLTAALAEEKARAGGAQAGGHETDVEAAAAAGP